jgi:hypothetical protein
LTTRQSLLEVTIMNARKRTLRCGLCAALALSSAGSALAARLHCDQTTYVVAPGASFPVKIYLDMNEAVGGDQMPATGLFSMGVAVTFASSNAVVLSTNDIAIPAGINTDGWGGPGIREVAAGSGRAAGVIPLGAPSGYTNSLMATVTVKSLASGTYQLGLALYRVAPWDNFLDFQGVKLDGLITNFVGATVQVQAAGAPEVRGLSRQTGAVLRIMFANTNFTAASVGVQASPTILPTASWTPEPAAVIRTNSPGQYQADIPLGTATSRFFRVTAAP